MGQAETQAGGGEPSSPNRGYSLRPAVAHCRSVPNCFREVNIRIGSIATIFLRATAMRIISPTFRYRQEVRSESVGLTDDDQSRADRGCRQAAAITIGGGKRLDFEDFSVKVIESARGVLVRVGRRQRPNFGKSRVRHPGRSSELVSPREEAISTISYLRENALFASKHRRLHYKQIHEAQNLLPRS